MECSDRESLHSAALNLRAMLVKSLPKGGRPGEATLAACVLVDEQVLKSANMIGGQALVTRLNACDDVAIACKEIAAGTRLDEYGVVRMRNGY